MEEKNVFRKNKTRQEELLICMKSRIKNRL